MYNENRPLHSAATLTSIGEPQQLELVNILLEHGADRAYRNKANKLPVELVPQGREKVIFFFFLLILIINDQSLYLQLCAGVLQVKAVLQARSRLQQPTNSGN